MDTKLLIWALTFLDRTNILEIQLFYFCWGWKPWSAAELQRDRGPLKFNAMLFITLLSLFFFFFLQRASTFVLMCVYNQRLFSFAVVLSPIWDKVFGRLIITEQCTCSLTVFIQIFITSYLTSREKTELLKYVLFF